MVAVEPLFESTPSAWIHQRSASSSTLGGRTACSVPRRDVELLVSVGDVQSAFHCLQTDEGCGRYFHHHFSVRACEVSLGGGVVSEVTLGTYAVVHFCAAALLMGHG